ncbi:hypothetical protein Hanom_Chr01g00054881 [Helianthus anomalus]
MAASTSFNVISTIFIVVAVVFSATVSAQTAPATAPAGMESGSSYSMAVSGLILCASMIVSAIAFIEY